jgi:hypothetical protein
MSFFQTFRLKNIHLASLSCVLHAPPNYSSLKISIFRDETPCSSVFGSLFDPDNGTIYSFGTSVDFHETTRLYISEDGILRSHICQNFELHIYVLGFIFRIIFSEQYKFISPNILTVLCSLIPPYLSAREMIASAACSVSLGLFHI